MARKKVAAYNAYINIRVIQGHRFGNWHCRALTKSKDSTSFLKSAQEGGFVRSVAKLFVARMRSKRIDRNGPMVVWLRVQFRVTASAATSSTTHANHLKHPSL